MNTLLALLLKPALGNIVDMAICFLRVSVGILIAINGLKKLLSGAATWRFLGATMENFGIYFWPVFWGLAATLSFLMGGIMLALGCGTRVAALFLAFTMVVAFNFHIHNGDSYEEYSMSLMLLAVFLTFLVIGGGLYSLDYYLVGH